jgi:hypothetical protein
VTGIEQIKPVTPQPPSSSVFMAKGGTWLQSSALDIIIFSTLSIITKLRFIYPVRESSQIYWGLNFLRQLAV